MFLKVSPILFMCCFLSLSFSSTLNVAKSKYEDSVSIFKVNVLGQTQSCTKFVVVSKKASVFLPSKALYNINTNTNKQKYGET